MHKTTLLGIFLLSGFLFSQLFAQNLIGFNEEQAKAQKQLEKDFDAQINIENYDEWMKYMSARPHHVGSPYGKKVADFMVEKFRSWGFEAELEEYQVLFPTPKVRLLELLSPGKYKAGLTEPPVEGDPSSDQAKEILPSYNCFSVDGDVTAELVYVNYGVPADYEELENRGIDVKGKIVIAKYFGSWRGIKPKVAAEKGAIGCIIYSDPQDDGYVQGDVYPKGAYKSEYGVQRGSVLDMPLYPGDPLTPGYGATKDAQRIDKEDAPTLTQIPVLPISYADAKPLLEALEGPVAPGNWRGGLPITYHIGPGPAKVRLKLEFNWELKPAYNVIAKMKGSVYPDQWVIRGNHHDAWVHGANDPISGMIALMEEARAIGELTKTGWRPKRTLVYCGWDAEEPGLLGSTEWVEDHAEELKQKAVIYINTDGSGRGFLFGGGSHSLQTWFDQITRDVTDPQTQKSVYDRRKALAAVQGNTNFGEFPLSALGSGSDYTPFIQHLGIPAMNLGFGGENGGGEYHTIYDTYYHYIRFKNPGFHYLQTLTEVCGRASLRFSEADILPFRFTALSKTIDGYLSEIMKATDKMRKDTRHENMLIEKGFYKMTDDPRENWVVPETKAEVPFLNFAPLQNAVSQLKMKSAAIDKALMKGSSDKVTMEKVNDQLFRMERALTREKGLPGRSWFRHHIYAPGFYTGYGVKTLPGVREAIEQRDYKLAQEQIDLLADILNGYSKGLEEIMGTL